MTTYVLDITTEDETGVVVNSTTDAVAVVTTVVDVVVLDNATL